MEQTKSADGTTIAFDRSGEGPALILVSGALSDGSTGIPLADRLAPTFTVYRYDRRGRGSSGDTSPYAAEREIEDLGAVIAEAGGSARVFGHSSGAALALEAAARKLPIAKLAVYEPPYVLGSDRPLPAPDLAARLHDLVSTGQRGEAVTLFMVEGVGMPPEMAAGMASSPVWPPMEALAHTIPYDVAIVANYAVPAERLATIRIPTLAIDGGASPDWARHAVREVASIIPGARHLTLGGQTHIADVQVLAPVLAEFLS
ncbi:MAG TPA: alpha/beta hydrolase [Acidimicrobiales bacterium]|nr:alpha/beta hydrolase [Acidimicrobiales bacterium]